MAKSQPGRPARKKQPAPLEGNRHWRERGRVRRAGPATVERSWWEGLPEGVQHALCVGFLVVVAVAFCAPVTFGGRMLAGGDIVQWRGMAQAMLEYESRTGTEVLWSPNLFGGMPGFLIDYPPQTPGADSILRGLRGLGLWPLAHLVALMLGTYALVVYLTRSKLGGTLAAVAYGLTTYLPIILVTGHTSKFIALAMAPWLLLAFAAVVGRPPASGWLRGVFLALLFAIAVAVNLRAMHVQITYFVAFVLLVWWLVEAFDAVRLKQLRAFAGSTALLALGGVLGLLMVAQPYYPLAEYKAHTIRSAGPGGGLAWDYAMAWSQGAGEMLTLLVANAFGGASPTYWGEKLFTAGPYYVGVLVIGLALLAVFGVRRRATTALGIAAVLMALFALGEHFALLNRVLFEVVPLWNSFRAPEMWLSAVCLVLAVLAGIGLYYLGRREATPEAEERKSRALYLGTGALFGFVLLLVLAGGSLFPFQKAGEADQIGQMIAQQENVPPSDPRVGQAAAQYVGQLRAERAALFRGDALRALGLLAVAAVLVVLYRRRTLPAWAFQAALVLLVVFDLWGVGRRYLSADSEAVVPRGDLATALPAYDYDRFLQGKVQEAGGPGHFRVLNLTANPTEDARSAFFYESIGGYHAAKLARYQEYLDDLLLAGDSLNTRAINLMSGRYVVANGLVPGMTPLYQDPQTGAVVQENPRALPRAFFVDSAVVVEDDEAARARLLDPRLDLRRVAVLSEPPPQGFTAPADTGAATQVRLERFTPDEIVWRVRTDRPRLLVASEVFYPAGWRAFVGDQAAPILRANYLLRAVPVPAGQHLVTMRFAPERHRVGLLVSSVSSLLVYLGAIVLGGLLWYRRGHPH
ncbi:MAG TPA: YfhO family protein [Rubricoccaceae bacterium]|nr:YfhO family protein [Rubricoccaceae bacterium]